MTVLAANPVVLDDATFGLTMIVVGMGGTLLTLFLLTLVLDLLRKIFPHESKGKEEKHHG